MLSIRLSFYEKIKDIINRLQNKHNRKSKNDEKLKAFREIGKLLVEEWPSKKRDSRVVEGSIAVLAKRMVEEFSSAFDQRNLAAMRTFYLTFPEWQEHLAGLTWSHYRKLLRIVDQEALKYYLQEALNNHWSTRQLARQIDTFYYERLTNNKGKKEPLKGTIKDTIVFEFLDLDDSIHLLEKDLENALLDKLQLFLLEMGKGFAFVARQQRIFTASGKYFYIDLVFYHFILKCFILVDLKTGELTHGDIGQMDMYVRLFEDKWRGPNDNPTLGIILCTEKDRTILKYSMLHESQHLFASRYQFKLPSKKEIIENFSN